ncbi:MAG: hypothetical protein HY235_17130 [Acidobacteria bacterium]|nr:hypothetical protein [Acidobacteriota bacterium]
MTELLLRLGIAFAAGALMRMLQLFGLPWPLIWAVLGVAGGFLSWRLVASRLFVVLLIPAGYFVAFLNTQETAAAPAEDSLAWTLVWNAIQLFVPLALPALGSMVALKYEQRREEQKEPEITEESLLAEKIPQAPVELSYELEDLDPEKDAPEDARRNRPLPQ